MFNSHYRQEIPSRFYENIYGGGNDMFAAPICKRGACINQYTPAYTNIPKHMNAYMNPYRNPYMNAYYERDGQAYFFINQYSLEYIWRFIILCVFCMLILKNFFK